MNEILFDFYGNPIPPKMIEKIKKSRAGAEKLEKRDVKCPHCGRHLFSVYGSSPDVYISAKCHKCKSTDIPLSMAYFRTLKGNR